MEKILAVANPVQRKFYLDPDLAGLTPALRREIKALCAGSAERIGATFVLVWNGEAVECRTVADEAVSFDEIGAALVVKEARRRHGDLLAGLAIWLAAQAG